MTQTTKTYNYFILYIILNFISGIAVTSLMGTDSNQMIFSTLWQIIFFVPILYIGVKLSKERAKDVFSIHKTGAADILLSIILTIAISPILSFLSAIGSLLFPNNSVETLNVASQYPLWLSILSLCIIPAVCEELVFRGVIFSGLKNMEIKKACLVGGFIFAVAHFSFQSLLYTFFIGTIFCYIVYRTKSVIPCIIAHFMLNFTQVIVYMISAQVDSYAPQAIPDIDVNTIIFRYLYMAVVALPIVVCLIYFMGKKYGRAMPLEYIVRKPEFIIENEEVFDYKPQKIYEDRVFDFRFVLIIVIYIVSVLYQYF